MPAAQANVISAAVKQTIIVVPVIVNRGGAFISPARM